MPPALLVAFVAFIVSLVSIPTVIRFAIHSNFLDLPAHRKTHSDPVPYLGGVAIFAGIVASLALLYLWYSPNLSGNERAKLVSMLLAGGASMLFGLIDDRFQIRARYKLLWQVVVAL